MGKTNRSIIILLLDKVFRSVMVFAINIIYARVLGPTEYGKYSLIFLFVSIGAVIAQSGLSRIIVLRTKNTFNSNDHQKIIITSITIRFISAISCYLFLLYISIYIYKDFNFLLVVALLALFGEAGNSFVEYNIATGNSVKATIINVSGVVIGSILKLIGLLKTGKIFVLLLAHTIERFAFFSIGFAIHRRKKNRFFTNVDIEIAKNMILQAWPILLANLAFILYQRVDLMMISYFLGSESVGLYFAPAKIAESVVLASGVIAISVYPKLIDLWNNHRKDYWQIHERFNLYCTIPAIIMILTTAIFGLQIITTLFGDSYIKSGKIIFIQSINAWLMCGAALRAGYLNMIDKNNILLYGAAIGIVFNIISNFLLIPIYGIYGAAISGCVAQLGSLYLIDLFFIETKQLLFVHYNSLFPFRKIYNYIRDNNERIN